MAKPTTPPFGAVLATAAAYCIHLLKRVLRPGNIAGRMLIIANRPHYPPLLTYNSAGLHLPQGIAANVRRVPGCVTGRAAPLFQTAKLAQHAIPTKFGFEAPTSLLL